MPDVIVNVAPQSTASVEVDVDNVASYYYDLAKQWAISPNLVEQLDYSSKYYANKSKEAADSILTDAGFIAVSQDLTNIDTVATSISNVNAVANDVTNINLVADDLTNIDSVAGSISNVNSVASDLTNIDSVAGDLTNIDIVTSAKNNIDTNATYISNINTVAGSITNVNTVAGDLTNINAVASDLTNVGTVASNITDVNTCSTNIVDINTCAANISTLGDKVNKSGDVMTGSLSVAPNLTIGKGNGNFPSLFMNNTDYNISSTTAPQADKTALLMTGRGANVKRAGGYQITHVADNNYMQNVFSVDRTVNGTDYTAYFGVALDNTGNDFAIATAGVKNTFVGWGMPDYVNPITGTAGADVWVQCAKDSFVVVWGTDSFIIDARALISPDKTNLYMVGFFYSDINSNTRGTSFTFPVPKGWWFRAGFENGINYHIYPLKGAQ